jgi:hypothetical protein
MEVVKLNLIRKDTINDDTPFSNLRLKSDLGTPNFSKGVGSNYSSKSRIKEFSNNNSRNIDESGKNSD